MYCCLINTNIRFVTLSTVPTPSETFALTFTVRPSDRMEQLGTHRKNCLYSVHGSIFQFIQWLYGWYTENMSLCLQTEHYEHYSQQRLVTARGN